MKNKEINKNHEEYWFKKFKEELSVLNLPTDYVRPVTQSFEGGTVNFTLSKEEIKTIKSIAKDNGLNLYMTILSIFTIFLSKLTGQENVIVGTPISSYNNENVENFIGIFMNTGIQNYEKKDESVKDFIARLKQTTQEAFQYQDYKFNELLDKIPLEKDKSRNAVFDVMFKMVNQVEFEGDLSLFNNNEIVHRPGISKCDLTLTAIDYNDEVLLSLEYCRKLFKPETINRYITYLKQIIMQIPNMSDISISDIELVKDKEKNELLFEFNKTKKEYPTAKAIHELFEEQVAKTPDSTALVFGNFEISYQDLNNRSNKVANYLLNRSITNSLIGIVAERSVDMVAAIFGVLKSGNAYLPLDINQPKERILKILHDSKTELVLTNMAELTFEDTEVINLTDPQIENSDSFNLNKKVESNLAAYVIYTSGSTGIPKGVAVSHSSLVNYIHWAIGYYIDKEPATMPLFTSLSFDLTITSIYLPLLSGNRILISPEGDAINVIEEIINRDEVNLIKVTPSHLRIIAELLEKKGKTNIAKFIVGGELLESRLCKRIVEKYSGIKIYNEYGPTETTVGCMVYLYDNNQDLGVPIGLPISNTQVYILDKNSNQLQPTGVSGELCISGEGLALGYVNNPELTKEKFISHPFIEGEHLYRTGDLVRWLQDGNMEFLGRIDHQVKIRGFRIELGDVEKNILECNGIDEVIVTDIGEYGAKYLCAYVVGNDFNKNEVVKSLSEKLPEYMIPSFFIKLNKIPLTSNGKVDRKALPEPEITKSDDYKKPINNMEIKLVEIWSQVLEIPKENISLTANFFEIGGTSVKIIELNSRINLELGKEIPIMDMFKYPTIKQFVEYITNESGEENEDENENADQDDNNMAVRRELLKLRKDS